MDRKNCQVMVQSFILAHFNYCPLVWYFISAKQVNKIEKVQERALRFISDDYFSDYESTGKIEISVYANKKNT